MRVTREKFDNLSEEVSELRKEIRRETVNYWGETYPTILGRVKSIEEFLNIETIVSPTQVKVVEKKKVSKK